MGCRFCDIKGVFDSDTGVNHVYYPLKHSTKEGEESYNTKNLPLRNHKSYLDKYYPQQVVWIENGEEELWAPKLDYTLNDIEFIALSNFYKANLDEHIAE
ncbi:2574_t:CDS:2, partial [Racocetra persica]